MGGHPEKGTRDLVGCASSATPRSPRSGLRVGAEVDDVAGVDAMADRALVDHDQASVAFDVDSACPTTRPTGARLGRVDRACRAVPGTGRGRRPAERHERPQQLGEHGRTGRRPRPVPAAPSGAHPTLSPSPTTTGAGGRTLGEDSGQLATVEQHVVRPLQPSLGAGCTARTASTPAMPTRRVSSSPVSGRSRKRIEVSRLTPGGASQRRSSRPRPAVW